MKCGRVDIPKNVKRQVTNAIIVSTSKAPRPNRAAAMIPKKRP